jgi:hypothetical protein
VIAPKVQNIDTIKKKEAITIAEKRKSKGGKEK